ncbi:MAG: ABC transporter permease [bacterium]
MIGIILKQSIKSLKANKLRTIFSVLGIVIGVGAVVVILSLGQGLKHLVTDQIDDFGPNIFSIAPKVPGASELGTIGATASGIKVTTLDLDDVKDLKNKSMFPYIEEVSGQAIGQEWVSYKNEEKKALIYGSSSGFLSIMKTVKIDRGRFFSEQEENSLAKVVVLGEGLAEKLFRNEDPLNKKIKFDGHSFKIVGVLKPYSGLSFGVDLNDMLYIPVTVATKQVLGIDYLSEVQLLLTDQKYAAQAEEEISRLMRRNHNITNPNKDDFMITTMKEILDTINDAALVLNILLGFLAAISLLVGGIGIMNIMLVSVSERTGEIGLRKALGATSSHILNQFLIESMIITVLGGLIGVIGGVAISLIGGLVARSQGLPWPIVISWLAVFVAFIVAAAVGIVFGIYPARKAAKLNPIDALKKRK